VDSIDHKLLHNSVPVTPSTAISGGPAMGLPGIVNNVHNSFLRYLPPDLHGLLTPLQLLIGEHPRLLDTFSTPLSKELATPSNLYGSTIGLLTLYHC
jgi:hypothetical protein